jgi:hypothetical protein
VVSTADRQPSVPPPPPAAIGGAGESRASAATWVAAAGAGLLLSAAATFLAVTWEVLGVTARVAVVAAVTGAAILGGARLRSVLPAVGTVVFHLGALLLPIDALGLALQLEAGLAARWSAVGFTAVLVMPPLAVAGGSRVLAWAGFAGIPVAATGLGLAGFASPLVVTLVGAAALVAVPPVPASTWPAGRGAGGARWPRRWDAVLEPAGRLAGPAVAVFVVVVPLCLRGVATLSGAAGTSSLVRAGWLPGWELAAVTGVAAGSVVAVAATRRGSRPLAILALGTALVAVLNTVVPAGTPRPAVLLVPAVAALLVELAAGGARGGPVWSGATRVAAGGLELLGASFALVAVLWLLLPPTPSPDAALAGSSAVVALAWSVGAARRRGRGPLEVSVGLALGVPVTVHLAAAVAALAAPRVLIAAVPLLGAGATLVLGPLVPGRRWRHLGRGFDLGDAAGSLALVLIGFAGLLAARSAVTALAVVIATPVVLGPHLARLLRRQPVHGGALAGTSLLLVVPGLNVLAVVAGRAAWLPPGSDALLTLVVVLVLASAVDRAPVVADGTRAVAAFVGLVAAFPGWPTTVTSGHTAGSWYAVELLGVGPAALVPATLAGLWLGIDAARTRRPVVAAMAVAVLVRVVSAGTLAADLPVPVVGAVLLIVAALAAVAAFTVTARWRWVPATAAVLAGPLGLALVADVPRLRAVGVVVAGAAIVALGALHRRVVVAHVGGAVVTLGLWWLLALEDVTALDVWALPVAVQLAVAGALARRRTGLASWVADAPAVVVVGVPALLERAGGGSGWHAVLAGAVAVAAIAAGGLGRLAGPLVLGTVLLAAVVGVEVVALVAAVPTWAWLALGGTVLLAVAAAIERTGGRPVRAARRAVDVVGERFV